MSVYSQFYTELFPPKPAFEESDFPDQSGRVIIVTGGNTGIGKATCEVLLRKNAKVYLAARSEEKATEAIADLKQKTGKTDCHYLHLDLADLTTIKASAETFLKQEDKLHVLFNSAGVMAPPLGSKTAQGYELQLGTNVLGHYLFTKLLLPTLEKTAQQLPNQGYNVVRIINTSSNGHVGAPAGGFKFEDPNGINSKWTLYGQSKWCNLVHADELARRYGDKGISAHSLNPGAISTDLQRHSGFFERTLLRPILNPVELGCLTQLYAGLMPEAGKSEHNGTYYIPWGREGIKRPDTQDKEVASKLWDWLDKETAQYA